MISVGVVGCSSQKLSVRAPARDLYCSALFRKSLAYAERACDHVVIASAAYGCVRLSMELDPYDFRMRQVIDRAGWGERFSAWLMIELLVAKVLRADVRMRDVELLVLAGNDYAQPIAKAAPRWGWSVIEPMAWLQIGERLRWLNERIAA